ncbi:MAG: hypothetical protein H0T53_02280 [Herpetosiphonaceae bacterium]|nr:hypothetical protein [Herpetosiphonaceae bacterium]
MPDHAPSTGPSPPTRIAALVGMISALGIALSPLLVWWQQLLGLGLSLGGQPAPQLFQYYYGSRTDAGKLVVFFGLICVGFWVQHALNARRWMQRPIARLLIYLYLTLSIGIAVVAVYAIINGLGVPDVWPAAQIGVGLYGLLGASLAQAAALIWLVLERASWAGMLKEQV